MRLILEVILFTFLGLIILVLLVLGGFSFSAALRETQTSSEAAPETGRLIETNEGRIFIQEAGPANGKPLLFIHGSLAWSETWREVLEYMSQNGYRAIALDLPPFGFSDRPSSADYSATAQAQRIISVVDSMQLQKPVLIGHSFGGSPTSEAAFIAPDKFSGLVLIDAAVDPDFKTPEGENIFLKYFLKKNPIRNAALSMTLTNPALTKILLQRFIYKQETATDKIIKIYQQPLTLKNSTTDLGDWLPTLIFPETGLKNQSRESYRNLNLPTLMIWGEKDTITPIDAAYRLDELIPVSNLHVLEEVGHIPQIEDPAQLNTALITGLKDLNL